jgi:transcriptional regulator with XRE-family HTH domain
MLDLVEIGERIRERRKSLGMSQADLALRSNVSRIRINYLENGRLPDMGVMNLQRVIHTVGLDLRLGELTQGSRPTFEDIRRENSENENDTPRLG